jgi:hypothetical protein
MKTTTLRGLRWTGLLALAFLAGSAGDSRGDFVTIATPTAAYTSSTTKIPITASTGTALGSVGDGALTIAFTGPTTVTAVGPGIFGWGTPPTVEEVAPPVLFSQFQLSRSLTFSRPLSTFGVEMESNNPTGFFTSPTFRLTATFFDNGVTVGSIPLDLVAPGGTRLFAATTTGEFTSVTLTAASGSGGFEFGQIRYAAAAVPEPSSLALTGIAGVMSLRHARRRRRRVDA